MLIIEPGPNVDDAQIDAIENEWGARLPSDYREFLARYNGGIPKPDTVDVPGAPGTPTDVQVFFGLGRAEETSNLHWNLSLVRKRFPGRRILPIACDSGGNLFCIEAVASVAADVIYCDLESREPKMYDVASGFTEFADRLRHFE